LFDVGQGFTIIVVLTCPPASDAASALVHGRLAVAGNR
jgi:hypothetical protein